jgi:UDP-N-acetylmuramoyl-L-alanyl-D-glutamate--2,6-diaminopimelate ligase
MVELDREKAIMKAIQSANQNDWILLAGKGHETDQVIGDQVLHHSDVECVSKYLVESV